MSATSPDAVASPVAAPASRQWCAAHLRSNHEWKAERYVSGRGVETFLPWYLVRSRWTRRTVDLRRPFFHGYLFVRIDPRLPERVVVLAAPGVVRLVGFGGVVAPIPADTIESLRLVTAGAHARPCPYLKDGARVRVTRGPLRGARGILHELRGRTPRLVVSIDILGRSVWVPIDGADLDIDT